MANNREVEDKFMAPVPAESEFPQQIQTAEITEAIDQAPPAEEGHRITSALKPTSERAINLVGRVLFKRDRHIVLGRHATARALRRRGSS